MANQLASTTLHAALALLVLATAGTAWAQTGNSLLVIAVDRDGRPVADAVAFVPVAGATARPPEKPLQMIQRDLVFEPYVLPVLVGTQVAFPNRDRVSHHLRTLGGATNFEFPVYDPNTTPAPVRFDKPGPTGLFCFFHLSMRGYIYAVDTPYFARTDANGAARIEGLPNGAHEVRVWHPDWVREPATARFSAAGNAQNVTVKMDFKPRARPEPQRRAPAGDTYKAGQGA